MVIDDLRAAATELAMFPNIFDKLKLLSLVTPRCTQQQIQK
jgi:hypothetical protein